MQWPTSEVFMFKILDLWSKIVGNGSKLHYTLNLASKVEGIEKEDIKQVETSPLDGQSIIMNQLKKGACYKVSFKKIITFVKQNLMIMGFPFLQLT